MKLWALSLILLAAAASSARAERHQLAVPESSVLADPLMQAADRRRLRLGAPVIYAAVKGAKGETLSIPLTDPLSGLSPITGLKPEAPAAAKKKPVKAADAQLKRIESSRSWKH